TRPGHRLAGRGLPDLAAQGHAPGQGDVHRFPRRPTRPGDRLLDGQVRLALRGRHEDGVDVAPDGVEQETALGVGPDAQLGGAAGAPRGGGGGRGGRGGAAGPPPAPGPPRQSAGTGQGGPPTPCGCTWTRAPGNAAPVRASVTVPSTSRAAASATVTSGGR